MSFSDHRVFLIGYMGSGKSTLGPVLAKRLKFQYFEMDEAVERWRGTSISDIFSESGEQAFRAAESSMLRLAVDLNKIVISTGGGLPMDNKNLKLMLNSGLTIYLETDEFVLAERIISEIENRPIHKDVNSKQTLADQISTNMKIRKPIYEEAHITLNGQADPQSNAKKIEAMMKGDYQRTSAIHLRD